jgi:hypothetical protein
MTPKFTPTLPIHTISRTLTPARILATVACALLLFCGIAPVSRRAAAQTPTLVVVRAMPVKAKKSEPFLPLPPLSQSDIGEVKVGGKVAPVTAFVPVLHDPHSPVVQLMVLLDSEQMLGSGGQFTDLKRFFNDLPSNVEIGVGWLLQGRTVVVQPFTTDRDLAGKALIAKTREEASNSKNDNGNPYQCLRDLAGKWPTPDPAKLRAELMFTDGIVRSNGQPQGGDQMNPDVAGASQLLQRSGVVPYPFFWLDQIVPGQGRSEGGQLEGQTNFSDLASETGGAALYDGLFAPGSLSPLLDRLYKTLESEAVLTVNAQGKPGSFTRIDIKTSIRDDIKIFTPDSITIGNVLKK